MFETALASAKRFAREEDGAFLIEFGLTFPVLILLSFGLLEFSLVVFDYQRAAEATRRGVRLAIIQEPIPNTTGLNPPDEGVPATTIVCTAPLGTVTCDGGSPSANADALWADLLTEMRQAYPTLTDANVAVTFEGTMVGDPDDVGGVFPLVTVALVDVGHEMMVGQLIGIDRIPFPDFKATVLGNGKWVNTAPPPKGT
ncbi:MAG: pilus assembly protein [Alphaproteobacteria bacterium]|nr:pilus assembly protein [Alphaproteobacteria bacterium]